MSLLLLFQPQHLGTSPSSSISASRSPSASVSPSHSASSSRSPSSSRSQSISPSASTSPSSSVSHSLSPSASVSKSISPSSSASASRSPSHSISASQSPSASYSPSASVSPSASPSLGLEDYSRTAVDADHLLPSDDTDLATIYTPIEVQKVANIDGVFVDQDGTDQWMIHQYKNFIGISTALMLNWKGRSTLSTQTSPIYLQIFNRNSNLWQTVGSDTLTGPNVDITLEATILDTSFYIDDNKVIASRVYQEAI